MEQNELRRNNSFFTSEESELNLLELFYVLLEKVKFIIAAALLGLVIMAVYSFFIAGPTYEATSKLYILAAGDSAINLSDLQIGAYLTSDYKEVFDTWEVQEKVLQRLNLDYSYKQLMSKIRLENPANTRMLYITASSSDPQEAADLANTFADVTREYISEMMSTEKPNLLSEALVPTVPVSPKKVQNMIIGFVLGALIMAAIFIVRFLLDDKVKSADDLRRYADMVTLATVPINNQVKKNNGKS